jgi:Peptidase A4 family
MAAKDKAKKVSRVTKTSRGFSIRTYETPPADFNPLKATARQLLRLGFPTRPDAKEAPELRKVWDREMSRPRQWITPEFKEMKDRSHGPALKPGSRKRARVRTSLNVANATSSNWSGSVAGPPANRTFGWIEGQWTVPNPHAPATGSYFASEWVGIDGWGSGDVLQAGTETEIVDIGFFKVSQVYPWWEWFPSGEVAITNLPVSAGDVMYCLICVNSRTTATVYLTNQSSLVTTTFSITAPKGTTLVGNSAEWVVERPTINGSLPNLTDYKAVYFDEGVAGLSGAPFTIVQLNAGTPITMKGNNNASLSSPTFETSQLMKVDWLKSS